MCCGECKRESTYTPLSVPTRWQECFDDSIQGDCSECERTTTLVIPYCATCCSVAVPLVHMINNTANKTCSSCWMEVPTVMDFGCGLDSHIDDRPTPVATVPTTETKDVVAAAGDSKASNDGTPTDSVSHVLCLDCFKSYASSSVLDRKLVLNRASHTYSVSCPRM
jgi:hypothetical protein